MPNTQSKIIRHAKKKQERMTHNEKYQSRVAETTEVVNKDIKKQLLCSLCPRK